MFHYPLNSNRKFVKFVPVAVVSYIRDLKTYGYWYRHFDTLIDDVIARYTDSLYIFPR